LWGLLHLPLNIFFYSPDTWVASVTLQIINCIGFAIFFGYGYLKTENIWVAVMMHYINNNMIAVIAGVEAVSNKGVRWVDIPLSIVINLVFILFMFSKAYKKEASSASDSVSV
ncbi:MAG: CPBP family intramembrane metalloprotease, partial [Acetatifactor sp.]|nr:CPBP family intramembrane metalloprotease [Acetatifactor sp.]